MFSRFLHLFTLLLSGAIALVHELPAQDDALFPSSLENGDNFGYAVDLHTGQAVISAPGRNDQRGAVFLFDLQTRQQIRNLQPEEALLPGSTFGFDVAINQNYVAASTLLVDGESPEPRPPSVHVFDRLTGEELYVIESADPDNEFGTSIDMNDAGLLVVGAPKRNSTGSVYVYNAATGEELHQVTGFSSRMGYSVSLSRGVTSLGSLLIGAPFENASGFSQAGAAYLVIPETGNILETFIADDGTYFDRFGQAVAHAGTSVVIGAPLADDQGGEAGKAYVFDGSSGELQHVLLASDGQANDGFGAAVSVESHPSGSFLAGRTAIIGAPGAGQSGAAYLFDLKTGEEIEKLDPGTNDGGARFGNSVALDSQFALIGASLADDQVSNGGAAYLFSGGNPNYSRQIARIDPPPGDHNGFGLSVAITQTHLAIGDYLYSDGGDDNLGWFGLYTNKAFPALIESVPGRNPFQYYGVSIDMEQGNQLIAVGEEDFVTLYRYPSLDFERLYEESRSADDPFRQIFARTIELTSNLTYIGSTYAGSNLSGADVIYYAHSAGYAQIIPEPDGHSGRFGLEIAASEDFVAIASTAEVYVYSRPDHRFLYALPQGTDIDDSSLQSRFGSAVAIVGSDIFVGAHSAPAVGGAGSTFGPGAVYRFDAATGTFLAKYVASDHESYGGYFGTALAASGNILAVGDPDNDRLETGAGCVYLFNIRDGTQLEQVFPNDPKMNGGFGVSIDMTFNQMLVGANGTAEDTAVYLFELPYQSSPDDWNAASGLQGSDAEPDADPNNDGVSNLEAFVYGAASPEDDASDLRPSSGYDPSTGEWYFTYRLADRATSVGQNISYSTGLGDWTDTSTLEDATREVVDDGYGYGVDEVRLTVPTASSDTLFFRLELEP